MRAAGRKSRPPRLWLNLLHENNLMQRWSLANFVIGPSGKVETMRDGNRHAYCSSTVLAPIAIASTSRISSTL